jgi:hypothetical protein
VHFVPIKRDHSDIAAQMQWCENNLEAARKISERASLYVHDMLFDAKAGKDNEEIRFRIMERYLDLYG